MINKLKRLIPQGFTLIETMVAMLLLAIAIAAPLTIASKGMRAALTAKDQIVGYYLAQDAMEFIRFARDTNTIKNANWLTGVGNSGTVNLSACTPGPCYLDSTQPTSLPNPSTCPAAGCRPLRFDTANKVFTNDTSFPLTPQRVVRTITIQETVPDKEAVVTVTVNWSDAAGVTRKPVIVRETLFNWQTPLP